MIRPPTGQLLATPSVEIAGRVRGDPEAWVEMAGRHGIPTCVVDDVVEHPGLGIVGYGKLGGAELGYGSDLDVVFIHNSRGSKQVTDGDRQLDNASFFGKVVQRFLPDLDWETLLAHQGDAAEGSPHVVADSLERLRGQLK